MSTNYGSGAWKQCLRPSVPPVGDLLPSIRRKVYMILRNEEECDVVRKAQRSTDDRGLEAAGSGADGGRRSAGVGGKQAHHLCVESEIGRPGGKRGPAVAAVRG